MARGKGVVESAKEKVQEVRESIDVNLDKKTGNIEVVFGMVPDEGYGNIKLNGVEVTVGGDKYTLEGDLKVKKTS